MSLYCVTSAQEQPLNLVKSFDVQEWGLVTSFIIRGDFTQPDRQNLANLKILTSTHANLSLKNTRLEKTAKTELHYFSHVFLERVSLNQITPNQLDIALWFKKPAAVNLIPMIDSRHLELVFKQTNQNPLIVQPNAPTIQKKLFQIGVHNATSNPKRRQRFLKDFLAQQSAIQQQIGQDFEIVQLNLPKKPLATTTIYYTPGNAKLAVSLAKLIKGDQEILKIKVLGVPEDLHIYLGTDY